MGDRVLITGGAGFIGSHLAERLLAEGRSVTIVDDFSTGSRANLGRVEGHPRLRVIEARVSQCASLADLAGEASLIYHLAAAVGVDLVVRSPIRTIETNIQETEAILAAAGRHGVPLLLTSTSEVYGKSQNEEFREEDDLLIGPPNLGRWSYACSKLMDEFLALAYMRERGLPVIIARVFNTVGPRQTGRYGMVLPRLIAAARAGQPLRLFGDGLQTRCFAYVDDTVEALIRLGGCPGAWGGVFNVGSTEETTIRDLALLVKELLKSRSELEFVPYDVAYAPGFEDMRRRRPSVDKLERLTGFRPSTPLVEIIRLTAGLTRIFAPRQCAGRSDVAEDRHAG
ncbi:MAG: NAD-dependent epimerase/dehydratase family protein [Verrucomicrobia bacterium]|jgi:UDP-glucose 4-epimerase|nr:NAD-dependent epimerase/dehydratase family protein [Verrucomicrobiota bacterium]MDI9380754.1 GDP-mannose 4,6-dehydratase [Verrucomicrobiota bacterium]NMD18809.1 NAD-dependent epimerase/dehydratase family protein [Verrucomicrobiota bacterium]HNU99096.1 GDP-mannose 4,6-dehydratase [Verrucomicrobiota bacterium]HOA60595.1 GDP-mannose 4,6-dehydratase [Verrucomicrobiota bacterium]